MFVFKYAHPFDFTNIIPPSAMSDFALRLPNEVLLVVAFLFEQSGKRSFALAYR